MAPVQSLPIVKSFIKQTHQKFDSRAVHDEKNKLDPKFYPDENISVRFYDGNNNPLSLPKITEEDNLDELGQLQFRNRIQNRKNVIKGLNCRVYAADLSQTNAINRRQEAEDQLEKLSDDYNELIKINDEQAARIERRDATIEAKDAEIARLRKILDDQEKLKLDRKRSDTHRDRSAHFKEARSEPSKRSHYDDDRDKRSYSRDDREYHSFRSDRSRYQSKSRNSRR